MRIVRFGSRLFLVCLFTVSIGFDAYSQIPNLKRWQELDVDGPGPHYGHAMAYDAAHQQIVMFGGTANEDDYGENYDRRTWIWDGTSWSVAAESGPLPRKEHAMAYDSWRGKVVMFGGRYLDDTVTFGDTWEWDGSTWNHIEIDGPTERAGCAMVFDAKRGKTVLYGGFKKQNIGAEVRTVYQYGTWEYDGKRWIRVHNSGVNPVSGTEPGLRSGHAMVYDDARGKTVLFGGSCCTPDGGCAYYTGPLEWDGSNWQWANVFTTVTPRTQTAMAYDSLRSTTVLFGGTDVFEGDTWEYDGNDWARTAWNELQGLTQPDGPPSRQLHAMAFDVARGQVVLFGGANQNVTLAYGDTWTYSLPLAEHDELNVTGNGFALISSWTVDSAFLFSQSSPLVSSEGDSLFAAVESGFSEGAPVMRILHHKQQWGGLNGTGNLVEEIARLSNASPDWQILGMYWCGEQQIAVVIGDPSGSSRTVTILETPFSAAMVQDYMKY